VAALLVLLTVPLAIVYWFIIHPFIRFWRGLGTTVAYIVVVAVSMATLMGTYRLRNELLRTDFGMNWLLFGIGLLCLIVSTFIGVEMRKQLTTRTLIGVPEIKGENDPQKLLTAGIYSKIRHPRYLSVLLGLLGLTLMANYMAPYFFFAALVPGLYAIIVLEERELTERFGEPYKEYCKRTPRLIPRL
jgi:protein-S-isoprenylcysteine O-methyltransferase Ste14